MSDQSDAVPQNDSALINVRKLAALDMVFHRPKLILAEYTFGVFFSAAMGLFLAYTGFIIGHFRVPWVPLLGCYLLFLAFNYVPLFLYAIKILKQKSAQEEVAFELEHKGRYARKYTVQSLLLLVPLVVPMLALYQERHKQA